MRIRHTRQPPTGLAMAIFLPIFLPFLSLTGESGVATMLVIAERAVRPRGRAARRRLWSIHWEGGVGWPEVNAVATGKRVP